MALISGLAGILGRFAGRLLNSSLGWATILLFGQVPGRKQIVLLLIALASVAWVVLLVGVLFPDIGTILIAVVPLPSFVDRTWVRIAMLVGAIILPLLVGIAAIVIAAPDRRPHGRGVITAVLRGYPFSALLALTIVLLAVVATVRKVRSLAHRREDTHVPVVVKPGCYNEVVRDLEQVLAAAELPVRSKPAPRILSVPPRLIAAAAGPSLGALVPDRLLLLKSPDLDILVYPSDLAINGSKSIVARARAAIASRLTHAPAYMTTTAEAESFEDELRKVADHAPGAGDSGPGVDLVRMRLQAIDRRLARLDVSFDEWETLYRERLQLERDVLAKRVGSERPTDVDRASSASRTPRTQKLPGEVGLAVAVAGLLALDLLSVAVEWARGPRRD